MRFKVLGVIAAIAGGFFLYWWLNGYIGATAHSSPFKFGFYVNGMLAVSFTAASLRLLWPSSRWWSIAIVGFLEALVVGLLILLFFLPFP